MEMNLNIIKLNDYLKKLDSIDLDESFDLSNAYLISMKNKNSIVNMALSEKLSIYITDCQINETGLFYYDITDIQNKADIISNFNVFSLSNNIELSNIKVDYIISNNIIKPIDCCNRFASLICPYTELKLRLTFLKPLEYNERYDFEIKYNGSLLNPIHRSYLALGTSAVIDGKLLYSQGVCNAWLSIRR